MAQSVADNEKPLVSVGIPTFNRPAELRRILRQMLTQTYENIEIIVLDNCSTLPEVEHVANEIAEKYPNVRYVKNKTNLGVLRNAAELINYANGEYFCWVSDDDYRSIDFIEKTVTYLQSDNEIAGVFCDFREVDNDGRQYSSYPMNHSKLMWFFSLRCKWFRRVMFYFSSSACGKCNAFYSLFRTKVLKNMKFAEISNSYTALNMDCMIVYQTLAVSPIAVLDFEGCLLTVGNTKNYQATSGKINKNIVHKFLNALNELNNDRKRYSKFSDPLEKMIITIIFPVKVLAEIIRVTLKVKCYSPFIKYAK